MAGSSPGDHEQGGTTMKKMLGAAVLAAAALTGVVVSGGIAVAQPVSAVQSASFTATALGVSPSHATIRAEGYAYGKAAAAGYQRSQCYVYGSSVRASDLPGTWYGTVTVACQS
ncbi:hypothetical protein [Amycolatopsis sp. NPDC059021]|uniref:hypothetical protein n=1 Tax=Amycolatopsis sp. NPDC059021 TaxID=3346704 RepID=UPI00366AA970